MQILGSDLQVGYPQCAAVGEYRKPNPTSLLEMFSCSFPATITPLSSTAQSLGAIKGVEAVILFGAGVQAFLRCDAGIEDELQVLILGSPDRSRIFVEQDALAVFWGKPVSVAIRSLDSWFDPDPWLEGVQRSGYVVAYVDEVSKLLERLGRAVAF